MLSMLTRGLTTKIRKNALNNILSDMSPEAIQKLEEINTKIENNEKLNADEKAFVDKIKTEIKEEQAQDQAREQAKRDAEAEVKRQEEQAREEKRRKKQEELDAKIKAYNDAP